MRKLPAIIITVIGVILIILGATMALPKLTSKVLVVTSETKVKQTKLNTEYQQQLIANIEKQIKNGYQVKAGKSKEPTTTFVDTTMDEYAQYKNCTGQINFSNTASSISYTLTTECKKDKGNLKVDYKITRLNDINIASPQMFEVSNGYFLIGTIANSNTTNVIIKFDDENNIEFIKYLTGDAVNSASSYATIADVYEVNNEYYLLGYVYEVTGGDYTNLILQSQKIYQEADLKNVNNGFAFLLKYDKAGNKTSEKLIDPIQGGLAFNHILGQNGSDLIITSSSQIVKYNINEDTFKFNEQSDSFIEPVYLKNNFIYGYSRKCNYQSINIKAKENALVKLKLSGKKVWSQSIESSEKVEKETCSSYINAAYNLGMYNAIVYNDSKNISLYNEDGTYIKEIDYSNLQKNKKIPLIIHNIENKNNEIKVILDNANNLIVDTFDNKYKLTNRYAIDLSSIDTNFESVRVIGNITKKEDRLTQIKMLNDDHNTIMKTDYLYD